MFISLFSTFAAFLSLVNTSSSINNNNYKYWTNTLYDLNTREVVSSTQNEYETYDGNYFVEDDDLKLTPTNRLHTIDGQRYEYRQYLYNDMTGSFNSGYLLVFVDSDSSGNWHFNWQFTANETTNLRIYVSINQRYHGVDLFDEPLSFAVNCADPNQLNTLYTDNNIYADFNDDIYNTTYAYYTEITITYAPMSYDEYMGVNFNQTSYDSGYSDGYGEGYTQGYTDGFNYADNMDQTAVAIFSGIISVGLLPINFFLAMLNFEVFGINIGAFAASLLTIAIIVIILRVIFSGGSKND